MSEFEQKVAATVIGALVGAPTGASIAFLLAFLRDRYDERRARIEKYKTALFTLMLQREFLRLLRVEFVPHLTSPMRAYVIRAFTYTTPEATIDIDSVPPTRDE